MESRIPIPTDNIYKFYGLFGLLLVIFSLGAFLYVIQSANNVVYASVPELEGLKQMERPSAVDTAKIALLNRRLEITKSDKEAFMGALAVLLAGGLFSLLFGFYKWEHEVQPLLDRTTKAQAQIAELQLLKLQRELGIDPSIAPVTIETSGTNSPLNNSHQAQVEQAPELQANSISSTTSSQ